MPSPFFLPQNSNMYGLRSLSSSKLFTGRRFVISFTGALPTISVYSFLHSPQNTVGMSFQFISENLCPKSTPTTFPTTLLCSTRRINQEIKYSGKKRDSSAWRSPRTKCMAFLTPGYHKLNPSLSPAQSRREMQNSPCVFQTCRIYCGLRPSLEVVNIEFSSVLGILSARKYCALRRSLVPDEGKPDHSDRSPMKNFCESLLQTRMQ
jgi:hypothetical protein